MQDPEQWLEECPRRVLNVWRAYWQLEPWGTERELLSKVTATLKRLLALKISEDHIEKVLKSTDDVAACYMPGDWIGQPERIEISQEQYWQQVEQALAANGNHN